MDDDNGNDIIQKYLPIFLNLRQEALDESQKSIDRSESQSNFPANSSPDIFESENQPLENNIESAKKSQISISTNATQKRLLNNANISEEVNKKLKIDTELDDFLKDDFSDSIFDQLSDITGNNQVEDIEEEEFPKIVKFPNNSRLHRRRCLAEKRARTKIPILFIKDILKAKNWRITTSTSTLSCDYLYECDHAIFGSLICRATVVGIDEKSLTIFLEDGTGRLECRLDHEKFQDNVERATTNNLPIIHEFDAKSPVEYKSVPSIKWLERGDIVQILGKLRIYRKFRIVYVDKLCKEPEMSIFREFNYINFVKRFYTVYLNSKKYY